MGPKQLDLISKCILSLLVLACVADSQFWIFLPGAFFFFAFAHLALSLQMQKYSFANQFMRLILFVLSSV